MFAETLAGIALVKSAVDGIKSAIGTARDISEIADDIDKLFTGEQQIQKKKHQEVRTTHSQSGRSPVKPSTPNLALNTGRRSPLWSTSGSATAHGSRSSPNAPSGFENIRNRKTQRLRKEKQQEEFMIGAAVILGLLIALGVFAFLYLKFV